MICEQLNYTNGSIQSESQTIRPRERRPCLYLEEEHIHSPWNLHWRRQTYSSGKPKSRWNSSFFSYFQDKLKWRNSLPDIELWVRKSSRQGKLYRFKYEASREFLVAKLRGGTCTTARSDPPEEVIHRATYLYENGYLEYDLMNNNCEDFALYCKTGLWSNDIGYQGRSSQANMVHPTKKEDRTENRMQRFATAIPRSCSKRENKDLGVQEDVVKVPVEELSSFLFALSFT
ncbi:putative LRAT domain-containing protein [Helianthus annuus]|nr:putative LRAT domain-containing protein [Helianthus annuus]KAJ0769377.1 putative LRAT domain-containing protein [Helianthus annuus]